MPEVGHDGAPPRHHHLSLIEDRLRIATRAAAIGIWEWDLATGEMEFSQVGRGIFGFGPDEPITIEMVRAITHPEDLPRTSAMARRATDPAIRENAIYRYRFRRADTGEERWGLAYGEAQFSEREGKTVATTYIGTIQDITAVELAEHALAESEARLRLATDIADIAVWEVDVGSNEVVGSPELNRLCGFPDDANPTLDDFHSRYAPGERERLAREGAEMAARGDTRLQTELKLILPDGREKWLLLRAQVAPGSTGPGQRVIGALVDITERKRQEERLATVAAELRHRVKNSLAVVSAIAAQTLKGTDPAAAYASFSSRLQAIAAATDIVLAGREEEASLLNLCNAVLAPYRDSRAAAFEVSGPDVMLAGKAATALAMALHELGTNAVKYGSLSVPGGKVSLRWDHRDGWLAIDWIEQGGPPVEKPARTGFGTRLLTRGLLTPPDRIELDYRPDGLRCAITMRTGPAPRPQ